MLAISSKVKNTEMEVILMEMIKDHMKVNGVMTKNMDLVFLILLMENNMMANEIRDLCKEMVLIPMKTMMYTKVNG